MSSSMADLLKTIVRQAEAKGFGDAGKGCTRGECEKWKNLPVQTWRHKTTGEVVEPIWMWGLPKPKWKKGTYERHAHSCFFVCRKFHIHCCTDACCDSLETNVHRTTESGAKVCCISGRVLNQNGFVYDYTADKKGAYCKRRRREDDPSLTGSKTTANTGITASEGGHNTKDWSMMKTAYAIVLDTLFSKLRCELDATTRRAKYVALQNSITSYVKTCKKRKRASSVAHFQTLAIRHGWFSSANNYQLVASAQDPVFCARTIAPMLVCLFKTLNAMEETEDKFKCFPSFSVSTLYIIQKGVSIKGHQVVPVLKLLKWLLPHPSQCEPFFRFLWTTFYARSSTPTQRNFLTRTQNEIKASLNKHIKSEEQARAFCQTMVVHANTLRRRYADIIELNTDQHYH